MREIHGSVSSPPPVSPSLFAEPDYVFSNDGMTEGVLYETLKCGHTGQGPITRNGIPCPTKSCDSPAYPGPVQDSNSTKTGEHITASRISPDLSNKAIGRG